MDENQYLFVVQGVGECKTKGKKSLGYYISDPSLYDRHLNINIGIKNYNISIFTCEQ